MSTSRKSLEELSISEDRLAELAENSDAPIDTSDIAELDEMFWKNARVRFPSEGKERLTVRFDEEVVRWFRSQGRGYQTRMNAVLRSFYEAHKRDDLPSIDGSGKPPALDNSDEEERR